MVIFSVLVHQMCVLDTKKLVIAHRLSFGVTSYERGRRPIMVRDDSIKIGPYGDVLQTLRTSWASATDTFDFMVFQTLVIMSFYFVFL